MDEKRAREILNYAIAKDNRLYSNGWYLFWDLSENVTLDGEFSTEELEAIVWWMRNKNA